MDDNEPLQEHREKARLFFERVDKVTADAEQASDAAPDIAKNGELAESEIKQALFKRLLVAVCKVDFIKVCKDLGWVQPMDKEGNPKPPLPKHYEVAIIDRLLDVAKANTWHIVRDSGCFYVYNGARWVAIADDEFQSFLGSVAVKQGYPKINARHSLFVKRLVDQAMSDGFLKEKRYRRHSMINLQNGTLVLGDRGVRMKKFDHRDFMTHQLEFDYDPAAENDLFLDYLDYVLPDPDTQMTLQQVAGYLFIKGLKLELVVFLLGSGANGKSVFAEILRGVLGSENISHYSLESLTDEHGYYRARIKDKIVNFGTDIKMRRVDTGKFKLLASGEPVEARHPYGRPFIMQDYAKLIFNLNTFSDARVERTDGFRRRLLVIPFGVRIPDEKQDKRLHEKILSSKAGIMNWIITGAREVIRKERVFVSTECEAFKAQMLKTVDSVAMFVDEAGYKKAEHGGSVSLLILNEEYRAYCAEAGYKPLGRNNFAEALDSLGYARESKRSSHAIFFNVCRKSY